MNIVSGLIIGTVMMILGNIMPQAKQNFIFGLRTPWTLSNDKVWAISNRFTGKLFFAAGFLIILSVIIIPQHNIVFTISLVLLVAVIGTIHSFVVYKRIAN
ncbi:MAG TPA: SdpI family protein [Virgibacillus sp.]|nr:SdpI family protein [Virgibacillus sp.]